jgi:hypothetical protein
MKNLTKLFLILMFGMLAVATSCKKDSSADTTKYGQS